MGPENYDFHNKERYFENKLKSINSDNSISPRNKEIIIKYLRDSQLGKTIKKGQKKKIGTARLLQTAGYLTQMVKWFNNKDLDKISSEDMDDFIIKLDSGKILTSSAQGQTQKPLASATRSNIKKFMKKFYKHILGDGVSYPKLVEYFDTTKEETRVEAIPGLDEGINKMIDKTPETRKKAIISVSFDSGFRESELLSCSIKDLEEKTQADGTLRYYLTCRFSKTKPRTVGLGLSVNLLKEWLKEHPDRNNPNAQLWADARGPFSRVMFYKAVKLAGERAFNRSINVHQIRHTSATYWAPKLDRTRFCKKFGWSYNSSSPDKYIDYAKINQDEEIKVYETDEISKLQRKLKENESIQLSQSDQLALLKEQLLQMQLAEIERFFRDALSEIEEITDENYADEVLEYLLADYRIRKQRNENYTPQQFIQKHETRNPYSLTILDADGNIIYKKSIDKNGHKSFIVPNVKRKGRITTSKIEQVKVIKKKVAKAKK